MSPAVGEHSVWVQRVTNRPLIVGLLGLFTITTFTSRRPVARAVMEMLIASASLACLNIRVLIDGDHLEVGLGPWGWPAHHIPLSSITAARAEHLTFFGGAWGGWGPRVRPGQVRLVVGMGDALIVDLVGGRSFGVSRPGAVAASAFINDGVAASGRPMASPF